MLEMRDGCVYMTIALTDPNDLHYLAQEIADSEGVAFKELTDGDVERINDYVMSNFNEDGWTDEMWNECNDLAGEMIRRVICKE